MNWNSPAVISSPNADSPKVSMDNFGRAFSVWGHFNGTHQLIDSNIYVNGSWGSVQALSDSNFNASFPSISAKNGRAIAGFQLFNGSENVVQVVIYSNGSWSAPQTLSTLGFDARNIKVSMNLSGDAFAIWEETSNGFDVIRAAFFTNGSWQDSQILSDTSFESHYPDIALSDSGTAISTWSFECKSGRIILGSSFISGAWTSPIHLSNKGAINFNPRVAINANGEGIAFWERQNDPLNFDSIRVSHFLNNKWTIPIAISDLMETASKPTVFINNLGNIIAIWRNSSNGISIGANKYSAGLWEEAQKIIFSDEFANPKVGIDDTNHAIGSWIDKTQVSPNVFVSEFLDSWSLPEIVSGAHVEPVSFDFSMEGSGKATIVYINDVDFTVVAVTGTP